MRLHRSRRRAPTQPRVIISGAFGIPEPFFLGRGHPSAGTRCLASLLRSSRARAYSPGGSATPRNVDHALCGPGAINSGRLRGPPKSRLLSAENGSIEPGAREARRSRRPDAPGAPIVARGFREIDKGERAMIEMSWPGITLKCCAGRTVSRMGYSSGERGERRFV